MVTSAECLNAMRRAAGGALSDREAAEILRDVQRHRRRLEADGTIYNMDQRLRGLAERDAERARIAAALQRKHAALNAIARDRIESAVMRHIEAGLDYRKAVLAVLEGTVRGVEGARHSVAATAMAFEGRYLGGMMAAIVRDRPHLMGLLRDDALMADVTREMYALGRDGPRARATHSADAQYLADLLARSAEQSRADLNRLGANIGRLDGWTPQVHDDWRVMRVSADEWVRKVIGRIDIERSFPDVAPDDVPGILGEIYRTITTGRDREITAAQRGEFTGPANLARRLEQHRVLHFRSADDWLAYNAEFGHGNVFAAMLEHQRRAARTAAQMEMLGPNPRVMLNSLLDSLTLRIRNDATIPAPRAARLIQALDAGRGESGGAIASAWAEVSGMTLRPVDVTLARVGSGIRAVQSMSKLGGALVSSISDLVTNVANLSFQGRPLFRTYADVIGGYLEGRGAGERRQVAFLLGQGFDGLIGHIIQPHAAMDTAPGRIARGMEQFFRLSGLTWWTDTGRAVAGRIMAADMGEMSRLPWAELNPRYRHTLGLHGIDEAHWDIIRLAAHVGEDGATYLTPDRIGALAPETFDPLFAGELGDARARAAMRGRSAKQGPATVLTPAQQRWLDGWIAHRRERAQFDAEMAVRRFYADEAAFGVLSTDAAGRRVINQGTRPGTWGGEAIRMVMQFKGFPIAFTQRVLGRAVFGGEGGTVGQRLMNNSGHIGHLIAGLMVAGYAAMTTKDALRGYGPREANWRTILAALQQSGGAGIYGDYLFGQASRFGNTALETAAGPALSEAGSLINLAARARQGEVRSAEAFNIVLRNTPYVNLLYVRPALDYLVLNSLREAMSPGYLARGDQRRREDFGQERFIPRMAAGGR